ncbi:MAG: hypothetical protein AAFQ42_03630 [Pseudomonadota bacterium]
MLAFDAVALPPAADFAAGSLVAAALGSGLAAGFFAAAFAAGLEADFVVAFGAALAEAFAMVFSAALTGDFLVGDLLLAAFVVDLLGVFFAGLVSAEAGFFAAAFAVATFFAGAFAAVAFATPVLLAPAFVETDLARAAAGFAEAVDLPPAAFFAGRVAALVV